MKNNDLPEKLASPAKRALANARITSLKQLSTYTENEIAELHGIGKNALELLKKALAEKGWQFTRLKE